MLFAPEPPILDSPTPSMLAPQTAFLEGEEAVLEGHIEKIIFRSERNGFTVADFILEDGRQLKIVGILAAPEVDEPLVVTGVFTRDPRFGLQLEITGLLDLDVSEEVAREYLASGAVPGFGPARAAEVVEAYRADTLQILALKPDSLIDFHGVTKKNLPKIKRGLRETLHLAPIIGLFGVAYQTYHALDKNANRISSRTARRAYRRYGAGASEIIRANPWRLANDLGGVGFTTADRIALGLGCDFNSPTRVEAAVLQALRDACRGKEDPNEDGGHIVYPRTNLRARASQMCGQLFGEVDAAIDRLIASGEIEAIEKPEGLALPYLAQAERIIAAKIHAITSFVDAHPITVSEEEIDEIEHNEHEAFIRFSKLSDTNPGLTRYPTKVETAVSEESTVQDATRDDGPKFVFDPSQRRAIRRALEDRITIITGQPGTGKTTLVRAILDLADKHGLTSALVSPYGRAAKRLSEATGRKASTIHRFLRYHPEEGWRGPESLPDLLVVDEGSTLSSTLAARLFEALPSYIRIILVGDEDQLPSIEPGNVLGDLLGAPSINVLRLNTIHRTAADSGVPELTRQIRIGVRKPTYDGRTTRFIPRGNDVTKSSQEQAADIAVWIAETITRYQERIDEFQILCPMKIGLVGTKALNELVQGIVNPGPHERFHKSQGYKLYPGDRVLVTKNDYENNLFNGDVGKLVNIEDDERLRINFDGEERIVSADAGGGMILAYAITIHKAQGSEFPIVIIPMHTSFWIALERRLFYTAVSRARQTVAIVGKTRAIERAISHHDPKGRRTMLPELLKAVTVEVGPLIMANDNGDEDF
jgi:exodeoxyribonuclease V alpha subunit